MNTTLKNTVQTYLHLSAQSVKNGYVADRYRRSEYKFDGFSHADRSATVSPDSYASDVIG